MKRIGIGTLVVCGALCMLVSAASAAERSTFDSCDSAFNYGHNTAQLYVSAAMNRAACDASLVEKSEVALARSLRRQKIPAHNSESLKVCFYQGLYAGYVATLASSSQGCGTGLSLASVARAAVAVFTAMQGGLDSVEAGEVDQVFAGVFTAAEPDGAACESAIRTEVTDVQAGLDQLVGSVCWNE